MGLIEQELKELRETLKQYRAGKLTQERVIVELGVFSQTEKRLILLFRIQQLGAKNKAAVKNLTRANVIGDGQAIEIDTDTERELVKCPACDDELITRESCLDTSGSAGAYEECDGCEIGATTRRTLLPPERET